jgi:hypothetical protein
VVIGLTLVVYGVVKLFGIQFSIPDEVLSQPVGEVDSFTLAWFLAGHEPLRTCIGVAEVLIGLMFLIKKVFLVAALISMAVWIPVLLFDFTFMGHNIPLILFVITMMSLTIAVILAYRVRVVEALRILTVR